MTRQDCRRPSPAAARPRRRRCRHRRSRRHRPSSRADDRAGHRPMIPCLPRRAAAP